MCQFVVWPKIFAVNLCIVFVKFSGLDDLPNGDSFSFLMSSREERRADPQLVTVWLLVLGGNNNYGNLA